MDSVLYLIIRLLVFSARFSRSFSRAGTGSFEEWTPGKKRKILLVGYNGARNTGSDVRVISIAEQLLSSFAPEEIQLSVLTLDAGSMEGYFPPGVTLLEISSIFPLPLLRACSSHHAAVLCEGSTLRSTFADALTLFLCEAAGVMSSQKKPCIAYGSEVGAMDPLLRRAAVRLCRNTYFITRTKESLTALRELGLQGHCGTDTAWPYEDEIRPDAAEKLLRSQGWDGKKPLLGIAVIDPFCWPVRSSVRKWARTLVTGRRDGQYDKWYYFSDSPQRRAAFTQYLDGVAEGAGRFLETRDFYPVLIGMEKLDAKACTSLRDRLGIPCAMFLSRDCAADVMTGILRRLDLLLTSRYHAAVLSMRRGLPVVAVSMDERLDNLMRELSFDALYLHHVKDPDLREKVSYSLTDAWDRRSEIGQKIRTHYTTSLDTLDEMGRFLKKYLESFPE